MSADNGIYILKMKDQSRVIHAQAIENLFWSLETFGQTENLISTRILLYYNNAKSMTFEEAMLKAFEMEKEILNDDYCPILEYGISTFTIDKTWNEIVEDAKTVFEREKISVANSLKSYIWQWDIDRLNKIFDELKTI